MSGTPLTLGPLQAKGFLIKRSGIHWLRQDGYICRSGEVIGYCNVSIEPDGAFRPRHMPFASERELQVAFAPRASGRLRIDATLSLGGYLNSIGVSSWDPDTVVGRLEPLDDQIAEADAGTLRLLMLAGQRATGLADVLAGLLPGWHRRVRGWWCDGDDKLSTMLCLGVCDADSPVRGDQAAFLDMFEDATDPAHMIVVPNRPVTPCAPCLFDQFTRSAKSYQAIADDIVRAVSSGSIEATADDWLFVGALQTALGSSPIRDTYDLLTPAGLREGGRPTSILLSLNAEGPSILRHKTLGYHLHIFGMYQPAAGPAVRAWLAAAFEPVKRTIYDIKNDYRKLFDVVGSETNARFLVLNRMSTSGREDISTYAPFDHPMSDTLANIASKELNLMLHDLADEQDFGIIDVDAIAAELGGSDHLPDGVHQSGLMQAHVRAEILHALKTSKT